MLKFQKSHISISSNEYNEDDNNNNGKQSINNVNLEQYLNKLILISLKHKKFLERNDYFYSQLKRKNNIKKVKLKLTPFQKYEKYKMISKKIKSNKSIIPINNIKVEKKYMNDLQTTKNSYTTMKNKTLEKNKFCLTNYYPNHLHYNKPRIKSKTKIYINSINTNTTHTKQINVNNNYLYKPDLKIKKNKYSHLSYDNNINYTININKDNKIHPTFRYKTAFKSLNKRTASSSLNYATRNKRSIGIITSAVRPLRIANLKSRNNNNIYGLSNLKNKNNNYLIPLIHIDDSKFVNDIISNYK